ncbi:MAG: hypothetical protein RR808_07560 [Akkermansia sp.]
MKKYIISGIAAFITLSCLSILAGQSQASPHQYAVDEATCHQQKVEGVILCPFCHGKGDIVGVKCIRCGGRGILRENGQSI